MAEVVRWGIVGLGNIARKFAVGLRSVPGAELAAVGSRSDDKARAFAAEFGAKRAYGTYRALAEDPEVDVVYVASPHPMHHPDSRLCLEAGKAVLCEKPFTVNARELDELVAVARARKVFLMEAMWTRFLPAIVEMQRLVRAGAIGEPRMVTADFGFRTDVNPSGRLFAPALAGGGLLDVGVYTVSLATWVLGMPVRVTGLAHLGDTGVDEQAAVVMLHAGGGLSSLTSAIRTNTPQEARIDGSAGSIRIPTFWRASELVVERDGRPAETLRLPLAGNGYNYQAVEVQACLRAGKLESDVMPLEESRSILSILDELRRQWGLSYPMD